MAKKTQKSAEPKTTVVDKKPRRGLCQVCGKAQSVHTPILDNDPRYNIVDGPCRMCEPCLLDYIKGRNPKLVIAVDNTEDPNEAVALVSFDSLLDGLPVLDGRWSDQEGDCIAYVTDAPDLMQKLMALGFELDVDYYVPPKAK